MSVAAEPRAPAAPPPAPASRRPAAGWVAFAVLAALALAVLFHLGRGTTFYFDEWDWVQQRRAWDEGALLFPHNQHLSLVPVLIFKLGFVGFGIDSYVPYRLAGLGVHALVAALLFVYARRRVGDLAALAAAAVLLLLGPGWQDILWPFQVGYLGSLAAGIAALLALDREDRPGDVAAAALLATGLACSSLGLPILAAMFVEVLGRSDRLRRWWVVAVPTLLYGAWFLRWAQKGGGAGSSDNLFATPRYVADAASGASGALVGLGMTWGRAVAVVLLVALVATVLRRPARRSWRLAALVALPLLFWGVTGFARADLGEPTASRYLYPGVLFLLLAAVELSAGLRPPRPLVVVGALVLVAVLASNLDAMRGGALFLRNESTEVEGALTAFPLAARQVGSEFQLEAESAPQIRAATYLAAVEDLGSPAPPLRVLPRLVDRARSRADLMLQRAYNLGLNGVLGPPTTRPPAPGQLRSAVTSRDRDCLRAAPTGPDASIDVRVPEAGLLLFPDGGGATVSVRRFGNGFSLPAVGVVKAPDPGATLKIRRDASRVPWHARVKLEGGAVRLCTLEG